MPLARLTAYPPDAGAVVRTLAADEILLVGRAPGSGLRLEHPSVSRRHAEVQAGSDHWPLRDLGSKNGTFVDGARIETMALERACWLRFGDVHCEFALVDPAQAEALATRERTRRAQSQVLARQFGERPRPVGALLDDLLDGVLQLSGASRGFVLLPQGDDFAVCASRLPAGLQEPAGVGFAGSVGAVRRVLSDGQPLAVNRIDSTPWLAGRASVVGGGIQSLVCLPLRDGARVLGAVYADRSEPGEPITQLDLEILSAFAESAAVWVLAGHAIEALAETAPRFSAIVSARAGAGA
jgi:hypothetical protein